MTDRQIRKLISEIYRAGPVTVNRAMELLEVWLTYSPSDFVRSLERSGFTVNSTGKIVLRLD